MADIAALKAALDEAEATQDALIEERRQNRESMTRAGFRAYNEETKAQQVEVARAIADAQQALTAALNNVRSEALSVAVGTLSESGTQGGVS
jgi:Skp family chaperone for outer membrane proteins